MDPNVKLWRDINVALKNGRRDQWILLNIPGSTKEKIQEVRDARGNATEETRKKLRKDPLLTMLNNAKSPIAEKHIRAAHLIREAYKASTVEVSLRTQSYEPRSDKGKETESDEERTIRLIHQYNLWWEECRRCKVWIAPVIHVLTEPVTLTETDFLYNRQSGTTSKLLVNGLSIYCNMFKP